jgi:heat shock protein HtpX
MRFRFGRYRLLREVREPDGPAERDAAATLRRLAQQLDQPAPDLGVRDTDAPLCYTVSEPTETTLVVSTGVLDRLSPAERDAVLAHELTHIANGDHRWMNWVLAPLLAAEELAATTDDDAGDLDTDPAGGSESVLAIQRQLHAPFDAFWDRFYWLLLVWGAIGSGVFSRGRELAADDAAARLTGDPAALASALSRLDGDAGTPPSTDLREHSRSLDALSILPALDPSTEQRSGLRASHPPTARRIERLESLAGELADGQS